MLDALNFKHFTNFDVKLPCLDAPQITTSFVYFDMSSHVFLFSLREQNSHNIALVGRAASVVLATRIFLVSNVTGSYTM